MRKNKTYAPLAQLVEHLTLNQGVQGSNPWRCILKVRFWHLKSAGVGLFILTSNKSNKREKGANIIYGFMKVTFASNNERS